MIKLKYEPRLENLQNTDRAKLFNMAQDVVRKDQMGQRKVNE